MKYQQRSAGHHSISLLNNRANPHLRPYTFPRRWQRFLEPYTNLASKICFSGKKKTHYSKTSIIFWSHVRKLGSGPHSFEKHVLVNIIQLPKRSHTRNGETFHKDIYQIPNAIIIIKRVNLLPRPSLRGSVGSRQWDFAASGATANLECGTTIFPFRSSFNHSSIHPSIQPSIGFLLVWSNAHKYGWWREVEPWTFICHFECIWTKNVFIVKRIGKSWKSM